MSDRAKRVTSFVVARGPIPVQLAPGTLYVNPQGNRAHHLCACGCEERVLTPLNDLEWELYGSDKMPSLRPSVGNWNLNCKSHYFVQNGQVSWARKFSSKEIEDCRQRDLRPYVEGRLARTIRHWLDNVARFFRID